MSATSNPFLAMILNSNNEYSNGEIVYMDYVRGPFTIEFVPHIKNGNDYVLETDVLSKIGALIRVATKESCYENKNYVLKYKQNCKINKKLGEVLKWSRGSLGKRVGRESDAWVRLPSSPQSVLLTIINTYKSNKKVRGRVPAYVATSIVLQSTLAYYFM